MNVANRTDRLSYALERTQNNMERGGEYGIHTNDMDLREVKLAQAHDVPVTFRSHPVKGGSYQAMV